VTIPGRRCWAATTGLLPGDAYDEAVAVSRKESRRVDVRIGVVQTPKEIEVELPEGAKAEAVAADVEKALASETGVLWLTDRRGRRVGVPSARIAYVEIDVTTEDRRVGFGTAVR
jgi:hypothetical protein